MASPSYLDILSAAANVTGASIPLPYDGAEYTLVVWGNFSAGNFKLQMTPDNGTTWIDVPSTTFTAPGLAVIKPAGYAVRGEVAGGGVGVSVSARLFRGGNT